jgi:chromosome segregation ATPase
VVETVMFFALGFLAATLIALLVIPAINQRAERLAWRRAEALFPMSISELTAEKDHLRAEFAVLQRRIERKAEAAQAVKHQSMEELGRRAMRLESLDSTLAERNARVARLETELDETRRALAACEGSLAETSAALADRREILAALEITHRTTVDELASMRRDRDQLQASLSVTTSELTRTSHTLAELEDAYARIDGALTAALSEIDAKRIVISDLETRLMTQSARGDDFERALGERHSELSDERKRLTVLTKNLTAEQERGLILEQHIREIEAERDAKIVEISALSLQLEKARSESVERTARAAQSASAENEELRLRIKQVADQILAAGKATANTQATVAKDGRATNGRSAKNAGKNSGKRKRPA